MTDTVTILQGRSPKPVTFIYPYYDNPKFFRRQIDHWQTYEQDLIRNLTVIVVDDGSPQYPANTVLKDRRSGPYEWFPTRLFRIDVDVRWNWLAARNIGAHFATEGWMLMTDMDHVVPAGTLRNLVYGLHDPEVIYRFSRVGTKTTPHPNSWFMTRQMFWQIGGYDEAASGHYGTDGEYRRRCAETASVQIMDVVLDHHEFEEDASTDTYKRKQPEDAVGKAILRNRRGIPPKVLSFPYHEVLL